MHLFTGVDEAERIPRRSGLDFRQSVARNLDGSLPQRREDLVPPDAPEPIRRVREIRLLAMHEAVPVASRRIMDLLRNRVRLVQTREVQVQTASRSFGEFLRNDPLAGKEITLQ